MSVGQQLIAHIFGFHMQQSMNHLNFPDKIVNILYPIAKRSEWFFVFVFF